MRPTPKGKILDVITPNMANILKTILDAAVDAIYLKDRQGRYTLLNTMASSIIGKPAEVVVGHDDTTFFNPADAQSIMEVDRKVMEDGETRTYEESFTTTSGGLHHYLSTKGPIRDEAGAVIGIFGISRDITESRKNKEALKDSGARFSAIFNCSPAPMAVSNKDLRITLLNPAFVQTFGYTPEDIPTIDRWWPKAYPDPQYRQQVSDAWFAEIERADRTGTAFAPMEVVVRCKNGDSRIILARAASLTDTIDGDHVVILYDITEQKKTESALANIQKLDSLGVMAGGIAHDFNNILTAILGNLSLLQSEIAPEGNALELIKEAQEACGNAKSLSRQLLTFSKGGSPIKKIVDIGPLLMQTATFAARGSNCHCIFDLGNNPLVANVDMDQLSQVVQNLVINASQAMPQGGNITIQTQSVVIGAYEKPPLAAGHYVQVKVKDQGAGIAAEHLPRIFDPFYSTKDTGRGLGLATCYSIMTRHGGLITAESQLGAGALFTLYIPAADSADIPNAKENPAIIIGSGTILIVDDDTSLVKILTRILKHLGYMTKSVGDGQAALDAYKETLKTGTPYVAVILDLTIAGGMGGKETIEKLSAIVSSGYSNDPVMADFTKYGFHNTLAKPYRLEDVSEALRMAFAAKPR